MHAKPSLIIVLLAVFVWPGDVHAAPDELEQYLAGVSGCVVNMDVTDADAYFDGKAMMPVEGIWRMSGSEGLFAVVADPGTIFFRLIVVDSPDRNILPGTVMGACTAAGRADCYDARIYTSGDTGILSKPKRFTVTLDDGGRLIMVPVTNKLKVNLWRFLPYMFRMTVTRVNNRPDNLDGAVRVFPAAAASPLTPRYL